MTTIPESCAPVNARELFEATLEEAQAQLRQSLSVRLHAVLAAIVSHVVGQGPYGRRAAVPAHLQREGTCCRCGSHRSQRFSRNGCRRREPLVTPWGEIALALPRVRCACGGSV